LARSNRFDRWWFKSTFSVFILLLASGGAWLLYNKFMDRRDSVAQVAANQAALTVAMHFFFGKYVPDETVGYRISPHVFFWTIYPSDERGYMQRVLPEEAAFDGWHLHCDPNVQAHLEPSKRLLPLTLMIESLPPPSSGYPIQLKGPLSKLAKGKSLLIRLKARAEPSMTLKIAVAQENAGLPNYHEQNLDVTAVPKVFDIEMTPADLERKFSVMIGDFQSAGRFVIERLEISGAECLESRFKVNQPFVENLCNHGRQRSPEISKNRPPGTIRIAVLGDSLTFGIGVREEDTFCRVLERMLNERRQSSEPRYEVINFGVHGYSTDAERNLLESDVVQFEPNIVLVSMCANDHVSIFEELKVQKELEPSKWADAHKKISTRVLAEQGYSGVIRELKAMAEFCRDRGLEFVVAAFDSHAQDGPKSLQHEVIPAMESIGVASFSSQEDFRAANVLGPPGFVHPADSHPNEVCHRVFAEKIEKVLRERVLPKVKL
jgi:hypothetical protein